MTKEMIWSGKDKKNYPKEALEELFSWVREHDKKDGGHMLEFLCTFGVEKTRMLRTVEDALASAKAAGTFKPKYRCGCC